MKKCRRLFLYVLSDEVHADYDLTIPYTSAGCFEEIKDQLIIYTAISKTFNCAGFVAIIYAFIGIVVAGVLPID